MHQPTIQSDHVDREQRERQRQMQIQRNQAALEMLDEWDREDPEEQRETLEYLMRVLDEDRSSFRKLFTEMGQKAPGL